MSIPADIRIMCIGARSAARGGRIEKVVKVLDSIEVAARQLENAKELPEICPLCLGDGEWENNITLTTHQCPLCKGSGKLPHLQDSISLFEDILVHLKAGHCQAMAPQLKPRIVAKIAKLKSVQ